MGIYKLQYPAACGGDPLLGLARLHFTPAIRGRPRSKAEPIRPFFGSLTNFATGPCNPVASMIRAILTSGSMRSLRHKPDKSCATKRSRNWFLLWREKQPAL